MEAQDVYDWICWKAKKGNKDFRDLKLGIESDKDGLLTAQIIAAIGTMFEKQIKRRK